MTLGIATDQLGDDLFVSWQDLVPQEPMKPYEGAESVMEFRRTKAIPKPSHRTWKQDYG